jgi:DNA-binding MarR family transcriptional regulator
MSAGRVRTPRQALREQMSRVGFRCLHSSEIICIVANFTQGERQCHATNEWLATELKSSPRSIGRFITKLCREGWLERTGSTTNRLLHLTPKSRAVMAGAGTEA